jgi:hypothetical protein
MKYFLFGMTFLLIIAFVVSVYGRSDGSETGHTKLGPNPGCGPAGCHGSSPDVNVSAIISGPSTVPPGETRQFSITVNFTGHSGASAGVDIAVRNGTLSPVSSQLQLNGTEITHNTKLTLGTAYNFNYTAPNKGAVDTIYAAVVGERSGGGTGSWNWASNVPLALPIQLSSFTGSVINATTVQLDWSTISEVNNYGFFVERRAAAEQNFIELPNSFVPGHGTTSVPQHYSHTDAAASLATWYYRLKQIDLDGTVHYTDGIQVDILTDVREKSLPEEFALSQNYPNPFNPSTQIQFALPEESHVKLEVYNALGQRALTLVDETKSAGFYSERFDATGFASGFYVYRLQAGDFVDTKKLLLLK